MDTVYIQSIDYTRVPGYIAVPAVYATRCQTPRHSKSATIIVAAGVPETGDLEQPECASPARHQGGPDHRTDHHGGEAGTTEITELLEELLGRDGRGLLGLPVGLVHSPSAAVLVS